MLRTSPVRLREKSLEDVHEQRPSSVDVTINQSLTLSREDVEGGLDAVEALTIGQILQRRSHQPFINQSE